MVLIKFNSIILDYVMKVTTPEISWHERDPIYSVDIQPGRHKIRRLVSGGVDKFVRVCRAEGRGGEGGMRETQSTVLTYSQGDTR